MPANVGCAYFCAIFWVPSLSFYWNRYVTCPLSKNIMMIDETSAKPLQKQFILKMMISFPRLWYWNTLNLNILKHKILSLLISNSVYFYWNGLEPTKRKWMPSKHANTSREEDRSIQNIQILNYFSLTSELNTNVWTQIQHAPQGKKS